MVIVILATLGLCIGSFVCASVWRLHEQMELSQKKHKTAADKKFQAALSISKGRSMCGHCRHELAAKDLVPLFSWVWLRGKCRYCQKPIGLTEPIAELVTATLFVLSYLFWPQTLAGAEPIINFAIWLVLVSGFVALAIFDLKWFILPDKIVLPLTLVGGAMILLNGFVFGEGLEYVALAVTGGVMIAGLFYALFQYSGGRWIGGGDVKLAFLLGLLATTPLNALFVIFFSSIIGTLIAIPLLAAKKASKGSMLPYGPMLLAATIIVVLFGERIVHAYEVLFIIG